MTTKLSNLPRGTARSQTMAKRLRKTMSPPEVILWQRLRGSPAGLRFRRQHAVGRYILDFYCHAATLAVEVDGAQHGEDRRQERDRQRDSVLAARGIETLRVTASEVLKNPSEVADRIIDMAMARAGGSLRSPPPPPLRGTSPTGEEA